MSENKTTSTFFQTLLGTLQGINNEGSAKRASTFYLVVVILTSLIASFVYGMIVAVNSSAPTEVHLIIVKAFITLVCIVCVTVLTLLGFATMELITALVKKVTGANTNDKGTNPEPK